MVESFNFWQLLLTVVIWILFVTPPSRQDQGGDRRSLPPNPALAKLQWGSHCRRLFEFQLLLSGFQWRSLRFPCGCFRRPSERWCGHMLGRTGGELHHHDCQWNHQRQCESCSEGDEAMASFESVGLWLKWILPAHGRVSKSFCWKLLKVCSW